MNLDELYFKDNFTKEDNKVKLSIDELNVGCITSKDNKFLLNDNGDLNINSLITNTQDLYPVGSIYMNITKVDPSNLFGGIWEQIAQGRTLVGVDENDIDFNTSKKIGGSKYLQEHTHTKNKQFYKQVDGFAGFPDALHYSGENYPEIRSVDVGSVSDVNTGNSGNLQPYFTCYIWSRIK